MPKDLPKMPEGLEDLLRGLSKAVLKEKPQNIIEFSAKYFENLLVERDGSLMKNYERFEHYEKSINKFVNQKKVGSDSVKKIVKSGGKNGKTVINPKVSKRVQNTKPNDKVYQKNEKVPSPIFGDKVVEKEPNRKIMEAVAPRGKLKTRTRSSISLNAITEESSSEMKEERRIMYRNAVKKIQRAFRQYIEAKKQKSLSVESSKSQKMDEDRAARIIQNLFKLKFPKKTSPQRRPRSIKNKTLERVAEGGEDSKSLLEYLQEEENAKRTQPNIEHDSDTGEITRVDGVKISKADSLENMIINEDMNREQNSKSLNLTVKLPDGNYNDQEQAAIKIQSTFRGHQARKDNKQQRELENKTSSAATPTDNIVVYKNDGEMELAAVKIQKNYRGYKVRKDILSTKNLLNSGNLVAAAGNIIGSVVNNLNASDLHSNNEFAELNQLTSDKHSEKINSEGLPTYEAISDEVNEIHGTVPETPGLLNNKNIGTDDKESEDSNSTNTKSEVLQSSSVSEVSQNTTQDIEHIIGINEQERESESVTTKVAVAESSQIPEGILDINLAATILERVSDTDVINTTIDENTQIPADIHNDLVVLNNIGEDVTSIIDITEPELQLSIAETETVENNQIPDRILNEDSTLEYSAETDTQNKAQELKSFTTEVTAVNDSAEHELLAVQESANQDVESLEGLIEHKPEIVSLATEAIQDHPILNFETTINETPVQIQNIQEVDSVLNSTDPNHETQSLPTELTALQDDSVEIQSVDLKVHNETHQAQPAHLHIIPEVTIDGASEEILSDSELVDDNQNYISKGEPLQQENQENLLDLDNPAMKDAALIIQKTFRGHQVRQNLKDTKANQPKLENSSLSRIIPEENKLYENQTLPLQTEAEDENDKPHIKTVENQEQYDSVPDQHIAALKIQKTYRGHQVRKDLKQRNVEISKSTTKVDDRTTADNIDRPNLIETSDITLNNDDHQVDKLEEVTLQKQDSLPDLNDPEIVQAALRIQKALMDKNLARPEQNRESQFIDDPTNFKSSENDITNSKNIESTDVLVTNSVDENIEVPPSSVEPKLEDETRIDSTLQTDSVVNPHLNSEEQDQVEHFTNSAPNLTDPEKVDAAIKIQKTYRGHRGRKVYKQKKEELERKIISGSGSAKNTNEEPSEELHSTSSNIVDLKPENITTLTPVTNDVLQPETTIDSANQLAPEKQDSLPDLNDPEMADAALKIQKSFRGHQARKDANNIRKKRSIDLEAEPSSNLMDLDLPVSYEQIVSLGTGNDTQNSLSNQTNRLPNLDGSMITDGDSNSKENEIEAPHTILEHHDSKTDNITTLTPVMDGEPETAIDSANQLTNDISTREKEDSLPDLNDPEMADAALKIQKSFRGHQARKDANNIRKKRSLDLETEPARSLMELDLPVSHEQIDLPNLDGPLITDSGTNSNENVIEAQHTVMEHHDLKTENMTSLSPVMDDVTLQPETAVKSANQLTNNILASEQQDSLPDLNDPEMADAALKIQKSFRGHQARKDANNIRKKRSLDLEAGPASNLMELDLPVSNELIDSLETGSDNVEDPMITVSDLTSKENEMKPQHTVLDNQNTKTENITTLTPDMDDASLQPEVAVVSANQLTDNNLASEQQDSLPDLKDPEMAEAALKIQNSFRGHQARKDEKIKEKRSTDLETDQPINNLEILPSLNEQIDSLGTENDKQNSTSNQSNCLPNKDVIKSQDSLPDLNDPEMADAALKIQKSFRSHQTRKEFKQQRNDQFEVPIDNIGNNTIDIPLENQVTDSVENLADTAVIHEPLTVNSIPKERQESLPDLNDPEMANAALAIQKSFRVHQARKDQMKSENQTVLSKEAAVEDGVLNETPITATTIIPTENNKIFDSEELMEHNTKVEHEDSLPDLDDPEMADAALKIQKSFRGHQARKEIKEKERDKSPEKVDPPSETTSDMEAAIVLINHQDNSSLMPDPMIVEKPLESATAIINQEGMTLEKSETERQDSLPDLNDPEIADAALKIQNSFRSHQARKESNQHKLNDVTSDALDATSVQIENGAVINPKVEYKDNLPHLDDSNSTSKEIPNNKCIDGTEKQLAEDSTKLPEIIEKDSAAANQTDLELVSSLEKQDSLPDLNDPEMGNAALKIQKSFRGHKARKELQEAKENVAIDKILSGATAPPADDIVENELPLPMAESVNNNKHTDFAESNILNNIVPDIISKAAETAATNIQRTYRGYRTRRDLKSQNTSQPAADLFEDENKLVDSLEPILNQKSEDKIDADSLDNFNVEEKTEVVEEPCQKIVYKSKLSMLIENSKSDTQSSSSDKIESKPNDDYFDSLENTQTSEMDESAQTVIEVQQPTSMVDTSYEGQNTYDSSIFGLKIEPQDMGELEQQDMEDDSISRKTTAEVEIADSNVETRGGMTDDEIKEIQNIDLAAFEKDSLEAMYYSLRKNELLIDQMNSLSNVEQISDQTEPLREFTGKHKLMSMGESDSDDIVFKQLSIDYDEGSENSNQHTARSTTDDDADVEVVRDVLYYNDGKQVLPDHSQVKREPGDGASVASDNLFDNQSNADDQEVVPGKQSAHHFEIFSLDEEIKNLESNDTSYQQDNPLFYAQQKIEKFLHQIHGNRNETEDDADDENDDDFLDNPIDSNKSYLSENNFNVEDEEEDDVIDELRTDFRELSARKVLSSAVSEADSDYIEQSRAKPIKDDFNISTALDNYLSTDSDSTYNSAATKIQAGARGFLTRRRIQSINRQSISERRSSIGNAAIDQSLDDMIEENEERKKLKFHEAQSTFREDTLTSSGEMEMYGITDIKVEEKKFASPITDSGNESTTSIDAETQAHLRNKYERFENEPSFDAIDEDNLSDVVNVIRTSNVQNKLRSPIKNKALSNINFDEYDRVATRRMTLQRGNAVQGNSTPSDEENKSHSSMSGVAPTNCDGINDKDIEKKTSYDSPIRLKSTESASLMTKSSNSLPDLQRSPKRRGFIQRQRTMPVQIETEIIRPLPKHMRKRIKSANSSAHSSQHATNSYKKKATY